MTMNTTTNDTSAPYFTLETIERELTLSIRKVGNGYPTDIVDRVDGLGVVRRLVERMDDYTRIVVVQLGGYAVNGVAVHLDKDDVLWGMRSWSPKVWVKVSQPVAHWLSGQINTQAVLDAYVSGILAND